MTDQSSSPAEEAAFDPARMLRALDSHRVEYLLVGGLGAQAHGASRSTFDIDLVPSVLRELPVAGGRRSYDDLEPRQ